MATHNEYQNELVQMYEQWAGETVTKFIPLPRSGSDRKYFRIRSENRHAIGVVNQDHKENKAFLGFTRHFISKNLPVPEIYATDESTGCYLLEDLGDQTLFNVLQIEREANGFSRNLISLYKKVLDRLPDFQIGAGKDLDYSLCYPRARFDRQSMMWDLNYFKYYFLKLANIPYDEQALEDDFIRFTDYLMEAEGRYFLYRDFQSRNIMVKEDQIYFIDYQGGRKGALHYDLASLLFDAKADIPPEIREELLSYYLQVIKKYLDVDEQTFRAHFGGFVLIRIMQALGAYGFRGFYEKKKHFLASIPYALDNLMHVLSHFQLPLTLPTLLPLLEQLSHSEKLRAIGKQDLTVSVNSFSFKRGIPVDESGHGGGHVFDCRALPNPGRLEAYRSLTGKDIRVIEFLDQQPEVSSFFKNCLAICDLSITNYLSREFRHLTINFGCTGGQHRSVYMAEQLAKYLKTHYEVQLILRHREQELNPAK